MPHHPLTCVPTTCAHPTFGNSAPWPSMLLVVPSEGQHRHQLDDEQRGAVADALLARHMRGERVPAAQGTADGPDDPLRTVDAGGITFDHTPAARKAENREQKAETAPPFRFLLFALCFHQPPLPAHPPQHSLKTTYTRNTPDITSDRSGTAQTWGLLHRQRGKGGQRRGPFGRSCVTRGPKGLLHRPSGKEAPPCS
jgi:hypothetical protein